MRLLELIFMKQFLQGAHHNLIGDKHANRRGPMDVFLNRDRDGTLKRERAIWRELSVLCDEANRKERKKGAPRLVYQMPLQWTPGCEYQLIPYGVSSKSARSVKQEVTTSAANKQHK